MEYVNGESTSCCGKKGDGVMSRSVCPGCSSNQLCITRMPLFESLSEAEAKEVVQYVQRVNVEPSEIVFRVDDPSDKLIIVRYGKVKLLRFGPDGEQVLLDVLTRGDIYGGDELFAESRCQEMGVALESTGLCLIETQDIKRVILEKPVIGIKIIEYLNTKLNQTRSLLEIISIRDSRIRLARFLAQRSRKQGSLLTLSQEDVGHTIHLTKETVNRRLAELQKEGLVRVEGRKKIRVLNATGLEML